MPIGTTRPACAVGCSLRTVALAPQRRCHAFPGHVRSGLIEVGVMSLVLASCAMPTPQEASDAVLTLRQYEGWAWAVGIALIWGRSGVANPAHCRDRRPWHHLWDTARRIAGHPRPDHRRPSGLRPDAHLRAALRATLGWAPVSAQDGESVRPGRCLGDCPGTTLAHLPSPQRCVAALKPEA
jgi:hypothetical protein